jgi:uncharacterized protein YcbK (DUF882 family)
MGDISKHFSRSEFECKCGCGFNTVDVELIDALEKVRGYFDTPITITSGCRCPDYNAYVGGSQNSQHLLGRAADIVLNLVASSEVQDFLKSEYPDSLGIGSYDNFTHVDSRSTRARW